jgi:hypothetical protein
VAAGFEPDLLVVAVGQLHRHLSGRRTFITNLASKSVSVRVLAGLAGHSSIATAM